MLRAIALLAFVVTPFAILALPFQFLVVAVRSRYWTVLPQIFTRLLAFALGLRVTVYGTPIKNGPVLLVSNHISWLDIPAITSRFPVSFVAKAEVGRYPVVSLLARLNRTIFVDRTRRTDTRRTSREMGERIAEGEPVLLFAEGTSDIGTHVLPFRSALLGAATGALRAHTDAPVMIQPMAIAYRAISNLPLSRHERPQIAWVGDMGVGDNFRTILSTGPKDVAIAFGSPFPANGDRKALARRAEAAVREMLVALNRSLPLPSDAGLV